MNRLLAILFLAGITASQGQTLRWNPNPVGENVTSYNVYEHVGSVYNLLGTVLVPAPLQFSLSSLSSSSSHLLAVSAVDVRGEGPKSADILLPTLPTAPTGLSIGP